MNFASFAGHPRGLYVCFATELWERFSYYGMRALLIFYLTRHFLFSDEESYAIYGAYSALAWGLPVIGGILADRYLGARHAVVIGALLLCAGHLLLAVEGPAAMEAVSEGTPQINRSASHVSFFFLSLALIATGVGFLKTNISTLVGTLYARDDRRRDAGFTIFYLGINLGAAVAPLLCGWLGQRYGWSYGFGAAGIGMLIGLSTFLAGRKLLDARLTLEEPVGSPYRPFGRRHVIACFAAFTIVLVAWLGLLHPRYVGVALAIGSIALAVAILRFAFTACTPIERDRLGIVVVLVAFAIVFWSLYEQIGGSMNLFTDRLVDRRLFGVEIQAPQLQALPALFVIFLAPLFSLLWTALAARARSPGTAFQFSAGLLSLGIGFLMPMLGAAGAEPGDRLGLIWFALLVFFMVCGELCISPIAMSMITRVCPQQVMGMMMGSYLLSLSIGSYLAGQLGGLIRVELQEGKPVEIAQAMETYTSMYARLGLMALGAAALLYVIASRLNRRLHLDEVS